MLDLNRFREHPEEVAEGLRKRGAGVTVEQVLDLDKQRREGLSAVEQLRQTRNERSNMVRASSTLPR